MGFLRQLELAAANIPTRPLLREQLTVLVGQQHCRVRKRPIFWRIRAVSYRSRALFWPSRILAQYPQPAVKPGEAAWPEGIDLLRLHQSIRGTACGDETLPGGCLSFVRPGHARRESSSSSHVENGRPASRNRRSRVSRRSVPAAGRSPRCRKRIVSARIGARARRTSRWRLAFQRIVVGAE